MRKLLLAAALALAIPLGACGTTDTIGSVVSAATSGIDNPVGTQTLATVEAAYGAALSAAVTYKRLCIAKQTAIVGNDCRAIVLKAQAADKVAYAQILIARDFVKNKKVNAALAIATAQKAVAAFKLAIPSIGAQ